MTILMIAILYGAGPLILHKASEYDRQIRERQA